MQDINQSFDIPLHDIKPIVDIQEYSLYYFSVLLFFGFLLISGVIYILYRWIKTKNAFNIRREHLQTINSLKFDNSKEAAYIITLIGATFKDDSQKHSEIYEDLVKRLEEYKYRREVDKFDNEVINLIELYIGMINA